jgi:5-methylthioadenosine/S-adenosylhomocysteine deaminase
MTMTTCDLYIRADVVVTQNDTREVIEDGAVAISGNEIVGVGPHERLRGAFAPVETRHLARRLLMPGLINSHTHAGMTYFRGAADDLPLMQWLTDHIWPIERAVTTEIIHFGALLGCAEMLRSGTTTFCDMYLVEDETARAVDDSGIRATLGEGIFVFPSPAYQNVQEAYEVVADFHRRHKDHERIATIVSPHGVYTTTKEILTDSYALAERLDLPWQIHLAESESETAQCLEQWGKRPVAYLESLGLLSERSLLHHCVDLTDEEIALFADRKVNVVHNPESNMKLASGTARTQALTEAGVSLLLGTDGAASNNNLNMFTEMTSAALVQKALRMDPTAMSAQTVLDMATRNAGGALGWNRIGQLVPGFAADIIALDLDSPNMLPLYTPSSHLVYAATGLEVVMTMVAGRIVYEEGRFMGFDYPALVEEAARVAAWLVEQKKSAAKG